MPSPAQVRDERLTKLLAEFKGKNTTIIDPIYRKARELFPLVTKQRAKSYAEDVLWMLKAKKKEES